MNAAPSSLGERSREEQKLGGRWELSSDHEDPEVSADTWGRPTWAGRWLSPEVGERSGLGMKTWSLLGDGLSPAGD